MTKTTENITRASRIPAGAAAGVATAAGVIALSLVTVACAPGAPAPSQQDVVIDTIGDTIVVRTLAGSVWDMEATLQPEVSIGELDGAEEYLFGRVSSIAVDDDRNDVVREAIRMSAETDLPAERSRSDARRQLPWEFGLFWKTGADLRWG